MKNKLFKRAVSIIMIIIMVISIVPITSISVLGATSYKGKYITLQEYTSTGSRAVSGSYTGGSIVLTATNDAGTRGNVTLNNTKLSLGSGAKPRFGSYTISGGNISLRLNLPLGGTVTVKAAINNGSSASFKDILKIDSLKNCTFSANGKTYFKRGDTGVSGGGSSSGGLSGNNNQVKKLGLYKIIKKIILRLGPGYIYPEVANINTDSVSESTINFESNSEDNFSLDSDVIFTEDSATTASIVNQNEIIAITQIQDGWGYTTYKGVSGWLNLSYCSYYGVLITKPEPPTVKLESSPDIPETGTVTVSWNEVYDAKYYKAVLYNSAGAEVKAYGDLYGTTATFTPQDEGVYTVKVYAQNSMYTSDPGVLAQAITVHGKSKVTYLDYNGDVIGHQDVSYGNASTAPLAPEREGYSFYGWSESLDNVKAERTVTAQYTINEYKVRFFDIDGKQLGDTQMVKYHESATPPQAPERAGYKFAGWSSDDYLNVYKENKSDYIDIYPVYIWENANIPVTCNITQAARQKDGYYVVFDIENHVDKITRGRAVVCLKTQTGKLVYTTESAAFSIPKNSSETGMRVFVPCDDTATVAEVIILDSFEKSIPISKAVTSEIDTSNMWSEWVSANSVPAGVDTDPEFFEDRTLYRYKTKETATNSTNTKVGWTYDGTRTPYTGNWSGWTDSIIDSFDYIDRTRTVEKKQVDVWSSRTKYDYFHYRNPSTGRWSPVQYSGFTQYHSIGIDYGLSWRGNSNVSGWSRYGSWGCGSCGAADYWYPNGTHAESYVSGQKTQYRYLDTTYAYHFYRWTDFSDWQTTKVEPIENQRIVETQYQYRTKNASDAIEDNSGTTRTVSGTLDSSLAGKYINLYVVKYNANSDFTNEYVGQTTIGTDGSYSFSFKLREELSEQTGDMTAYIGVEGSDEMQAVEVFEAPKPIYTVKFYADADSTEPIATQYVEDGDSAVIPSVNPEKEGYIFAGWNNTCTNVKSDMVVRPIFVEQQYVVQYIDSRNPENNKTELCTYGTPFAAEDVEDCESGYARGWDIVEYEIDYEEDGKTVYDGEKVVTENTVVMAEYETKTYDVTFVGVDGEVLDTVSIEHEGFVEMPELPEEDGVEFVEWDVSEEELASVTDSITVSAVYFFDETTETPEISLESGAYNGTQTVTLSCDTPDSVIWYTLDGTDPSENPEAIEYTGPITISDTTVLNCFAGSINANDSDMAQACYVIDGNGKVVTVHNTQDPDCDTTFIVESMSEVTEDLFNYAGYDFEGFYYDEACTQPADLSNDTFGSEITLYTKYTIASYNVTFKDETRVVKTESVEYGSSATPPNMSNKGELVFLGWEGGDYEFVSEDLELTAIYKPKSEIVNIELNRSSYSLEEGSTFKLSATVTPEDKSDMTIIWVSEDDSIASVLDDGTVTANKAGTTKIYAVAEDDSAIAECSITVGKSPNVSLCLKETATIGLDTDGNLRGIPLNNNTVEFVSSQLRNTSDYLKFTKADGTVLTGEDKVGTGTIVSLMDGNKEVDTWTIVLTGDINGDCLVNVKDVSKVSRFVVRKETPDYYQTVASDVNGDGKVNNRDAAYLSRYLVGKEVL